MTDDVSLQRCAEAGAAAAQLRQQAEAAGSEEVRTMLQQLVGHVVAQKDKARHSAAKVPAPMMSLGHMHSSNVCLLVILHGPVSPVACMSRVSNQGPGCTTK